MKPYYLFALVILLALPLSAEAQRRGSELVDPAPINIPQGVSHADAREAIASALLNRGWTIAEESDRQIIADLYVRSHWAQIGIDIEDRSIKISYRDSDNLRHRVNRDGRTVIHRNYLSWVDNVVTDIRTNLARAQRTSRG